MASAFFRVTHEYDIGDRSVYFSFDESSIDETAKELAVYLQFKVEHEVDDSIAVDNVTVVRLNYSVRNSLKQSLTPISSLLICIWIESVVVGIGS